MTLQEQWDDWGKTMAKSKKKQIRDSTSLLQVVDLDLAKRVDALRVKHEKQTGFPLRRTDVFRLALEKFLKEKGV